MKLVFILVLAAAATHAQDSGNSIFSIEDRTRLIGEMMRLNPASIIMRSGATFSNAVLGRVQQAIQDVVQILRNNGLTFIPAIPDFVTWTPQEINGRYSILGYLARGRQLKDTKWNYTTVNYVREGKVSPVKNQGKCGSCYAFGAVAAIEAQRRVSGIDNATLSEQQIVDCSYKRYRNDKGPLNLGCTSGTSYFSMQFANETEMETSAQYPYTQKHGSCQSDSPRTSDRALNFTTVLPDNEDHLAYLLNKNGPLVVYIKVSRSFNYYSKGIYNDARCRGAVNHAMLLSGLGRSPNGQEYWILKNSYGAQWGDNGFISFIKGRNMCEMISNEVTIARYGDIITE